jgi:hypothetical protein
MQMRSALAKITLVCAYLTIIGLILPGQSFAGIDPETCMGAWLFDEDGADMEEDISGNENIGAVKGKPKWTEGKFGNALDCDGVDDYVDCGDKDSLDVGTGNFSIVAWIRCAKYDPGEWEAQIVYKFDHTVPRHGYLLGVRGSLDAANKNKPVFILGLGQDAGNHLFGTSNINDDAWHHLAMTVDRSGSTMLYRDGELEAQVNIAGDAKQNEDNAISFNIGSQSDALSRSFKGLIDEVALFKAVLTEDDIKKIMTGGLERALGIVAVSPASRIAATWADVKTRYSEK